MYTGCSCIQRFNCGNCWNRLKEKGAFTIYIVVISFFPSHMPTFHFLMESLQWHLTQFGFLSLPMSFLRLKIVITKSHAKVSKVSLCPGHCLQKSLDWSESNRKSSISIANYLSSTQLWSISSCDQFKSLSSLQHCVICGQHHNSFVHALPS